MFTMNYLFQTFCPLGDSGVPPGSFSVKITGIDGLWHVID